MNSILPIFSAMVAALAIASGCGRSNGQGASSSAPAIASTVVTIGAGPVADSAAQKLVHIAVANVDAFPTISGKIRHEVDLFGHQLIGSGIYLQQGRGPDRRLRLELKLKVDDQQSSLQQVCDGNYLWTHQDLLGKTTLTRVDLHRLRNALLARPNLTAPAPDVWTSLGGLPKLLKSLDDFFLFTAANPKQLDGLATWSIEGQWKPSKLAELLPAQKDDILNGRGADLNALPEQVPHRVVLVVGQDDQFPYRIEYWGSKTRTKQSARNEERLIMVMELFEVQTGAPIDPRQLAYKPGDLQFEDQTSDFLQKLGLGDGRAEPTGARPPIGARR